MQARTAGFLPGNRAVSPRTGVIQCVQVGEKVKATEEEDTYQGIIIGEEKNYFLVDVTHSGDGQELDEITREAMKGYFFLKENVSPLTIEQPVIKKLDTYQIVHFRPGNELRANEYIDPSTRKIDITSHGLGSGIYGIINPTEQQILEAKEAYQSTPSIVAMQNPLHLQDNQHATILTTLSKRLQDMAKDIHAEYGGINLSHYGVKDWVEDQDNNDKVDQVLSLITSALQKVGHNANNYREVLIDALEDFFIEYNVSWNSPIRQPINLLMTKLGYDGIYAGDTTYNSYQKGSVAYIYQEVGTRKITRPS